MPTRLQDNFATDQTAFVEQLGLDDASQRRKFDWRTLKQNRNLLPFYLLAGGFFLFVLLLFVGLQLANRPAVQETGPVRESVQVELGPLQTRVYQLRQELRDNDPTKQQLPFPLVDLTLSID